MLKGLSAPLSFKKTCQKRQKLDTRSAKCPVKILKGAFSKNQLKKSAKIGLFFDSKNQASLPFLPSSLFKEKERKAKISP